MELNHRISSKFNAGSVDIIHYFFPAILVLPHPTSDYSEYNSTLKYTLDR